MGNTKFQKFVFTLLMCFFMVLGMTSYNILLHEGWSEFFFMHLLQELGIVFIIALFLDTMLVGPLAKALAFRILPQSKDTKIVLRILSIALPMVLGMVLCMSIFGAVISKGWTSQALHSYPKIVLMNAMAALPLNLLIVSPLVRSLFPLIFLPAKDKI